MAQSSKKTKEPIKIKEKAVCKEPIEVKEKAVCAELTERTPVDTHLPTQVTKLGDGTVREDY